jgi:hypothetical protein
MSATKHSLNETVFRFVLVLLIVAPLIFIGFRMLVDLVFQGSVRSILLVILALVVCVQFKSWIGRLVALIFVCCILPTMVGDLFRSTGSFTLLVGIVVVSVAAYFIRGHNLGQKEHVIKTSGVERIPVLPPGAEQ